MDFEVGTYKEWSKSTKEPGWLKERVSKKMIQDEIREVIVDHIVWDIVNRYKCFLPLHKVGNHWKVLSREVMWWDFIFCAEYRLGDKSGSRKTSSEQAGDDGGLDQGGTQ